MDTQDIEFQSDLQQKPFVKTREYSIQVTYKNLLSPCSRCSSMHPRIPYEVIDEHGLPLCYVCAEKFAPDLFFVIRNYLEPLKHFSGLIDTEKEHCKYLFNSGFDKSAGTNNQEIEGLLKRISITMRKFGVLVTYYTNMTGNNNQIILGMARNDISDQRAHKAIHEIIQSDEKADSALKFLLMYDKIMKTID
jgi:hypothetical protein